MQTKTKIILSRPSEWQNRLRGYKVFMDNVEIGSIKNGATEEFLVSPGIHHVQCRMAWYSSPVFAVNIEQGSVEYLLVKSGMKYYWPMVLLLFAGVVTNLVYRKDHEERPLWIFILQFFLLLPSLLYMLYYLTVGRKYCLLIEEDKENIFAS